MQFSVPDFQIRLYILWESTVPCCLRFLAEQSDSSCFVMAAADALVRWPFAVPKGHQHELHDALPSGTYVAADLLRAGRVRFYFSCCDHHSQTFVAPLVPTKKHVSVLCRRSHLLN